MEVIRLEDPDCVRPYIIIYNLIIIPFAIGIPTINGQWGQLIFYDCPYQYGHFESYISNNAIIRHN